MEKNKNLVDFTGKTFGDWTVLYELERYRTPSGRPVRMWRCKCKCGNECNVQGQHLSSGESTMCTECGYKVSGFKNKKHGESDTKLYAIWSSIKKRCYNPNEKCYSNYGGRGITMCDEWKNDYMSFRKWAYDNGYDESKSKNECSIDRINVNGDYCPENCRWVDIITQANNKRNNFCITYNGETRTVHEWSRILDMPVYLITDRIQREGWTPERTFTTKGDARERIIDFNGVSKSIKEWSNITGLKSATISRRLKNGWSVKDALTKPLKDNKTWR